MKLSDKKEKLKKVLRGELSPERAFKEPNVQIWTEVSPGMFRRDGVTESHTYAELEAMYANTNDMAAAIIMFHQDGTPIPPLAFSERDIVL